MTPVNEAALLRAILEHPDDDLPRLAYADLMEERGDDARAEFIRVQLELDRLRQLGCHEGVECNVTGPCADCGREVEATKLEYRERVLFVANAGAWTEDLPEQLTTEECPHCAEKAVDWETGVVECRQCDCTGLVPNYDNIDFRRGFVERIELATADFLAHAKALFSRHPITDVVLTDREPYPNGAGQVWYNADRDMKSQAVPASAEIPTFLFHLLSNWLPEYGIGDRWRAYPDEAAALADLSRACVRHGRAEAGLGEL